MDRFYIYGGARLGPGGAFSVYVANHIGHRLRIVESQDVPGDYIDIDDETGLPI